MTHFAHCRRRWFAALMVAVAASSALVAPAALAAQPVVEIIAFAHAPVQSALKPLRGWLAAQGARLKVVEIDMETAAGEKRLQAAGVTGHVPVVVLIDGQHLHKRADGSAVDFVSFPAGPGTAPGVKGTWSAEDVKAVLAARLAR
jgi:ABC-type glycerol-3-phosphate transport system substrate-binding protein